MEQRFTIVTLGVNDLAKARAFYEKGLGWKPAQFGGEEIVFFQTGGCILGLFPRDELAKDMGLGTTPPAQTGGMAIAYNARSKEEVDQVLKQAVAAGAALMKSAEEVFWGGYSGYFADPDGHAWEVAFNPHWPVAEDGSVTIPQ